MGNSPVVNRINALLAEKGIQKQDLYKNCGITSASYSLWNTGKTTPRMKNLEVIADYLNTTTDYLLTGFGQKEKTPTLESGPETSSQDVPDENYIILSRNAKKLSSKQRQQLLDVAKIMFKEEFKD